MTSQAVITSSSDADPQDPDTVDHRRAQRIVQSGQRQQSQQRVGRLGEAFVRDEDS